MKFDINELFTLEKDSEILNFKITSLKIPVWLLVRHEVLLRMIELVSGINYSPTTINPFKLKTAEKIKYIYKSIKKAPFFVRGAYPIVVIGAGVNNMIENEYYYNRLYDPIYELVGDKMLLIEMSDKFSYPEPRFNKNLKYYDLIDIIPYLISKLPLHKIDNKNELVIDEFGKYLFEIVKKHFKIDFSEFIFYKISAWKRMHNKYEVRSKIYKYLIEKLEPRIVIVEDAHYCNRVDLITICKELNIKTAEIQHGYISGKHLAYNWHEGIRMEIKKYLPDYMLFWGDYWAVSCSTPSQKITIGFPYLEKKISLYAKREKDIDVLILSGGLIPSEYLVLGKHIRLNLPNANLVFRPHPSERSFAKERYRSMFDVGWKLDTGNLYETLSRTKFCISLEMTTTLYESLCFCDRVLLFNTKASELYIDENTPFDVLNTHEQVLEYLMKNPSKEKDFELSYIFSKNWNENLQKFLKD